MDWGGLECGNTGVGLTGMYWMGWGVLEDPLSDVLKVCYIYVVVRVFIFICVMIMMIIAIHSHM